MAPTRIQTRAVEGFQCLGGECPDTCCRGWGMQLTAETVALYNREAPELMDAITSGEAEFIMKRDPVTDVCVKLGDDGWCSIHRDYGDTFLGDACHFFPRITRAFGDTVHTTAALSCPETARLMLYTPDGFGPTARSEIRTPYSLKNYLPDGLSADDALTIHQSFLDAAGDESFSAEHNLMRVSATIQAIAILPATSWKDAVPMYLMMASGRVPAAEAQPADIFNLLHALRGLVMATKSPRPRLLAILDAMALALSASFDAAGNLTLAPDAAERGVVLLRHMRVQGPALQPVLRRYVQAQLSQAFFPFAGFGGTLAERMVIIGVRFATTKLALATLGESPQTAEVIGIVQTLSRFLDHLADPTLSLHIYRETGWVREARLRALIGDA